MASNPPILTNQPEEPKQPSPPAATSVARLALVAGLFVVALGWVDILVGWFPTNFGSPEWEFGAVSATVDGLPLSTIGMIVTLLGAAALRSQVGLWAVALWGAWVLVVLIVAAVLYWFTVPMALESLGPAGLQASLGRAVIKTSTSMAIYFCLYGWMEVEAIRALKRRA